MYKMTSRTVDGIGAQRGWKAREAAAREKMNATISPELAANLQQTAERLQAERDAVAAAVAEAERLRRETACPCPACDGGDKVLSVEEAAFIASALRYYRSKSFAADPEQYAVQAGRARVAQDARASVVLPMAEESPADHAETVEEAVQALEAKPQAKRRR